MAAKKTVVKKPAAKAEMKRALFFCPKLKKQVSVKFAEMYFSSSEHECELCGSHGHASVEYLCKCGAHHEVELHSW